MHIAVVMVSYGSARDVGAAIAQLMVQSHQDFRLLVCENGGEAAEMSLRQMIGGKMVGQQPVSVIAARDNPGYAGGINRCIAAAPEADAWWILNPDTLPARDALRALVSRLGHGDVAAVGGVLLYSDGRVQSLGGRWRGWAARCKSVGQGISAGVLPPAAEVEARLDYLSGASMLVSRAMIDRVGLMREDYFLYAEEVEWCLRARAAGLRFGFAQDAIVTHHQGSSTGSGGDVAQRARLPIYLDERNKLNVVRDTATASMTVAAISSLALLVVRYGKAAAWQQLRSALAGWRAGLRGERGKPAWIIEVP